MTRMSMLDGVMSDNQTKALNHNPANAAAPWQLGPAIVTVALLWIISSQGYYSLVDNLGVGSGYDDAPFVFAAYYLAWALITLWLFRHLFAEQIDRQKVAREAMMMLPILAGFALFVIYVLPLLPRVSELRAPSEPPEFMFASALYYLPKSADILFQQTLVAGLILTAARL